jgi:hypothetical protein
MPKTSLVDKSAALPDALSYALDIGRHSQRKRQSHFTESAASGQEAESWILEPADGVWSLEYGQFITAQLLKQTPNKEVYYRACCRFREYVEKELEAPEEVPQEEITHYRSLEDVASLDELVDPEIDCDVPPISPYLKSDRSGYSNGSYRSYKETSQTLIFMDWDDTLFPTTDLFDNWGLPSAYDKWDEMVLTEEQQTLMSRWSCALQLYLRSACSVADRVVILTNSKRPWVTRCIDRFAPKLTATFQSLKGLRIVYAKEALASQPRGARIFNGLPRGPPVKIVDRGVLREEQEETLTKAKLVAMQDEAKTFYSQYAGQSWKNILSIGDAIYEHDAAQELAFRRVGSKRERLRVKTIVTPARPLMRDLTYRLKFARLMFRAYVNIDDDFDINMNSPNQLGEIANVLGMPELHRLIPQAPVSDADEGKLEEDLEDIEFLLHDRTARQLSELDPIKEITQRQISELSTSSSCTPQARFLRKVSMRESDELVGA